VTTVVDVPDGGAWFAGHFPGYPILPGVAQFALALEALGHSTGVCGVAHARLRQLVSPGERLEIVVRDALEHRLRIELKRGATVVSNAEFILGTPVSADAPAIAQPTDASGEKFPALDDLMPHRPPMRFLANISHASERSLHGTARIPGECAMVRNGFASPLAAVEAGAQAAAAWEALHRWRDGGEASPRMGYLVALRDVDFFDATVAAERDLAVAIELVSATPPLTHYLIDVRIDGAPVVRGTIATYLTGASA
jgi:3-hydroxymyristoyl/3-hydroxydecanoyl-(acyl carrier protein) dehydratase